MSDAVMRSQMWRSLCVCFSPPAGDVWEAVLAEGSFYCIYPVGDLAPHALNPDDYRINPGMGLDELKQTYSTCFESGNESVSFHERAYNTDATSQLFEELFRYYEHFGLDMKDNDNANWPDSILVELDFMYYLSHLESIARTADDVLSLQRGQRDFLKRHLGPLVAGLSGRLQALGVTPYDQLAKLMHDYVGRERDYLNRTVDGLLAIAMVE